MKVTATLIVEDHQEARVWLHGAVRAAFPGSSCDIAVSVADARRRLASSYDLVLLDIGLPDGSGLDLVAEFAQRGAQVVITSVYEDDAHLFRALQLGANGYLLKDHPADDIVGMLEGIVLEGRPPLSPKLARRVMRYFTRSEDRAGAGQPGEAASAAMEELEQLTAREQDVLTLLAKGYTVPNTGELLGISANTVSGYAKSIYRKLNVNSRAEATLKASRLGLVDAEHGA